MYFLLLLFCFCSEDQFQVYTDVGFESQILCATLIKFQLVAGVTHFVSVYCIS